MFIRFSISRTVLLSRAYLLLAAGAALCAAPQAHAQVYLVGAEQFAATSTGATSSTVFQSTTNSGSAVTPLNITINGVMQNQAISFALSNGSDAISFAAPNSPDFFSYGGSDGDLGLFFSSTPTSYNPITAARNPDLLIARATDGSAAFFFPTAGTVINSYVFRDPATYGGATSFLVGTTPITVTQYSVGNNTVGTLTLQVGAAPAAVPEPGSVALLIGLTTTGAGFLARRRKQARRGA